MKSRAQARRRYRDYKSFFDRLKRAGACKVCGMKGNPEVMDFHHHYAPKKYCVNAGSMSHLGRKKILLEFMKCVQVCANCHRRLHAGTARVA